MSSGKVARASWFCSRRMMLVASATLNATAIDVFFVSAMKMLLSSGTTARNACGSTTSPRTWRNGRPIDRAASISPPATEFIPDRTASHTNADVYTVRAMIAKTKNENRMSSRGSPKTTNTNTSVSGVFRTTFT